ncbi:MAG TPA: D-glycerate dehydrogenase [Nocardioidaceae bacterium]|nr:D-glycerate dehydrogenase [Nocardioidaceae bacterium]
MSRVVVTGRIPQVALDSLRGEHDVSEWDSAEQIPRAELLRRVAGAEAIVSLLTERIDGEVLDAAGDQLRVVANVAVGYNNIDVVACHERGVTVTNTPDVLTEATADIAMGLILMVTRRLGEGERVIRRREPWQWGMSYMLGTGLQGKTLGIIGLGGIGAATARRARAFGMRVVYSSRNAGATELVQELQAPRMELDELLGEADVVSLHCPYTDATHHLIGAEQLDRMKDSGYLINTARGPIIDEAALATALTSGTIAGAGLDVFEREPAVHEGLVDLDNVVLLPHLGSATLETRAAMASLAADNALAVLRGQRPRTPVA